MKTLTIVLVISAQLAAETARHENNGANQLTPAERAAGWKLLFDGTSSKGWTGMRGTPFPAISWKVEQGMICTKGDMTGGDIQYGERFENFELSVDWKIAAGGNSGIKYLVQPEWVNPAFRPDEPEVLKRRRLLAAVGPEYQVYDDEKMKGKPEADVSSTGALYLLVKPENKKLNSPGEWNVARIVVNGKHVEHWLNGSKLLEYELDSQELFRRIEESKFRKVPGYGIKAPGYVVLQHHNSPAWFRNVKIRTLPKK
jgi:hypothetical protein